MVMLLHIITTHMYSTDMYDHSQPCSAPKEQKVSGKTSLEGSSSSTTLGGDSPPRGGEIPPPLALPPVGGGRRGGNGGGAQAPTPPMVHVLAEMGFSRAQINVAMDK